MAGAWLFLFHDPSRTDRMRQHPPPPLSATVAAFGVLFVMLAGPEVCAQDARYTLSGFVTDRVSNERLAGAAVYVRTLNKGAVADSEGFISLRLPAGSVALDVSFVGYEPRTLRLYLARDTTLALALMPSNASLGEVEVMAEREENAATSTRMSAITLPVEEIEKLPAFLGEVDVIKTIQLLPGVQSGTEGSTNLYVRGGGPDQNLILLDGAPIYNVSHVFGFLSVFNADALDDVKLVKGGFPARYGGRLSSVVDLRMKEGYRDRYAADGTLGLVFSSLTAQGPLLRDRASFVLSARRTYIDVLAQPFLNSSLPTGQSLTAYFYDMNARLDYTSLRRGRFSLSLYRGRDGYGTTHENTAETGGFVYRDRSEAASGWGNAAAVLRWRYLFSNTFLADTRLIYSRYDFDIRTRLTQAEERTPPVQAFAEARYVSGIRDGGGRVDFSYRPRAAHDFRFGAGLTRHSFNPGAGAVKVVDAGVIDTSLTPTNYPFSGLEGFVYAEDDAALSPRIKANAGLHLSGMYVRGRTYASLQPRLSVRCLLRPDWSVKASFSLMQQYLHLLTNTGINLPTDLWVAATDRIRPQQSWQAAIGTGYAAGAWELSLEGYYKDLRRLIEYKPGAGFAEPGRDWQDLVERGPGWSYGAEVFLRNKRGRTTGWIGYTLSRTQRRFDALNDGASFPYRYDRRHDVSLVVSHRLSRRLDAGLTWVYGTGQAVTLATTRLLNALPLDLSSLAQGGQALPQLYDYSPRGGYRMAPFHRLDLALNWHFGKAFLLSAGESTLSVGAYNVYNRHNPFYLFATRNAEGRRVYRQASLFPVLPFVSYRFNF